MTMLDLAGPLAAEPWAADVRDLARGERGGGRRDLVDRTVGGSQSQLGTEPLEAELVHKLSTRKEWPIPAETLGESP